MAEYLILHLESNVSLYASTYLIVSIAVDRLLCVLKPIGVIRKRRRYKMCMIAVPWILSFSINIPILYWTTIFSECGCHICTPDLRGIREVSQRHIACIEFQLTQSKSKIPVCFKMVDNEWKYVKYSYCKI
jgi:hypothetical protein